MPSSSFHDVPSLSQPAANSPPSSFPTRPGLHFILHGCSDAGDGGTFFRGLHINDAVRVSPILQFHTTQTMPFFYRSASFTNGRSIFPSGSPPTSQRRLHHPPSRCFTSTLKFTALESLDMAWVRNGAPPKRIARVLLGRGGRCCGLRAHSPGQGHWMRDIVFARHRGRGRPLRRSGRGGAGVGGA